jgi:ornithine decarboxylase
MPPMSMIDIGGGFPGDNQGTYREGQPTFQQIAATVRNAVKDFKADPEHPKNVRFIAEPGRYFVSRSTTIATKVYSRKGGKSGQQALYVDDGVYGSFNNVVYDHYHPKPETLKSVIDPSVEVAKIPTAVFGPTCDGLDQICAGDQTLLERAEVGDWLIFRNMGAYTHTASFVFNGYTHIPKKLHCVSTGDYEESGFSSDED